jgi:hypothetical protein
MNALGPSQPDRPFHGLWSLWDMLKSYFPIYQIALELQKLRSEAELRKSGPAFLSGGMQEYHKRDFNDLLERITQECPNYGFTHTAELAKRPLARPLPETYGEIFLVLTHLDDSLSNELEKEAVFRIPPERKGYFEQDELFGPKVAAAFPSCARDIQKAGSCYTLGQEDACVHHLMLVLERGLNALAGKVGATYARTNWQNIIEEVSKKVKSLPKSPEKDFYLEINAQFGFLKDAYRNHAEHARDIPSDMEKALSILNHVRAFMGELVKGGLSE